MNSNASYPFPPPEAGLEFLARVEVELGPMTDLGDTGQGNRRVIPIIGGKFEGPRFKGRVPPGGADWQILQKDGVIRIDTRYALETDDGALLYIVTQGVRYAPPEVLALMAQGQPVDPRKYYFRTTVKLETGVEKYAWLNRVLGISAGMRLANQVIYNAYIVT
jgi:hypothetical protein